VKTLGTNYVVVVVVVYNAIEDKPQKVLFWITISYLNLVKNPKGGSRQEQELKEVCTKQLRGSNCYLIPTHNLTYIPKLSIYRVKRVTGIYVKRWLKVVYFTNGCQRLPI